MTAFHYIDLNQGLAPTLPPTDPASDGDIGWEYVDLNQGLAVMPAPADPASDADIGWHYVDLETTDVLPQPEVWWLVPDYGRVGAQFMVVGVGFGATEATWGGVIKLGQLVCSVVSWTLVGEEWSDPDDRFIDFESHETNIERVEVVVTVPAEAVSSVVTVTVTDGA